MTIYLDFNATAPLRPEVASVMQYWFSVPANPSSVHSFGRAAKKQLEDARKTIAEVISCFPNEIIFMGSGTEANITALQSFSERKIFVSAIEHSSVLKNIQYTNGGYIPVDINGIVKLSELEVKVSNNKDKALVSVMLANNETGVIQPISEIAEICKKYGALLHCDAVQALGKIPLDFSLLGVDVLTISAHKMGGAIGSAALVVKNNLSIKPLLSGGGQELGRRAGTENIAAIAGFAKVVELIDMAHMKNLRQWLDEMEMQMKSAGGIVFAKDVARLPNTTCVAMPNVGNETQLIDFDLKGFAVSAGSACSSGRIEKSHVLLAMGVSPELASSAIRISAGWNTTKEEIDKFIQSWLVLNNRLKSKE